jgi:hypothetical protein
MIKQQPQQQQGTLNYDVDEMKHEARRSRITNRDEGLDLEE